MNDTPHKKNTNDTKQVWDFIMNKIDTIPPTPRWIDVVLHIFSIIICGFIISQTMLIARAQPSVSKSLEVQQAVNERDIATNLANIAALKVELNYQRDEIVTLRDSASNLRGMVTGIGGILGFLNAIQILVSIRGFTSTKKHEHA